MNLSQLAKVLLVKACEEHDPEEKFILRFEREQAGLGKGDPGGLRDTGNPVRSGEAFVMERAEQISDRVTHKYAALQSALTILHFNLPIKFLIACCLVGGFLADPIGPAGQINLLNFSLLTLLLWNGIVYAGLLMTWVLSSTKGGRSQNGFIEWLSSLSLKWPFNRLRLDQTNSQEELQWITKSLGSYSRHMLTSGRDVFRTHVRSFLHAAAAALAIGVIAGLYLRGFSFLYKAGWNSTFLEAEGVHSFLSVLFIPASFFLQTPIPGVETIANLRGTPTANAAIWIHFWAMTSFLFIVLPRSILAIAAWIRKDRLAADVHLPLNDGYFRRLLSPYLGRGMVVEVIPYSYRGRELSDSLIRFCGDVFGTQAHIHMRDPVQYGELLPDVQHDRDVGYCAMILFNLAQPPEETHSEFLEDLKQKIQERGVEGCLLLLIDMAAYSKIENAPREVERIQAWKRLAKASGLTALEFGAKSDVPEELVAEAHKILWPICPKELL